MIVNWYLSSKTGLDSKKLKSKNSSLKIFAWSFSDTLASIARLGEEKRSVGTCDWHDNKACVVFKDPSTMAPAIPGVAADIPGTGTLPSVEVGWKPAPFQTMHWVLRCCLLESCWLRWRVTAPAIRATNWPNIPEKREMGCDQTGAVLDRGADWSVLATEDESRLVGLGHKATSLDFLWGGSPPAAIAEGLECFGGILSLKKKQWKKHQKLPKTIFLQLNINSKTSHGKTKRSSKASLSDKQSTHQLPSYAKINLNANW